MLALCSHFFLLKMSKHEALCDVGPPASDCWENESFLP